MAGFQLSLELTRLFAPSSIKKGYETAANIISWARNVRQTGSDVVVEMDMASVFGRGQIELTLGKDFQIAVMKPITLTPFGASNKVELSTGAGPTLAWKQNPFYRELFASIVQLSFLGWIHDRTALAATLNECLDARFDNNLSTMKSPGFDGIFRTLESISSETSNFDWSEYVEKARSKLCTVVPLGDLTYRGDSLSLPPEILLRCLDTLYVVQKDPDERFMTVNEQQGMLTLIVWAHYILGLSVLVKNMERSQEVMFSSAVNPNPVIIFHLYGSTNAPNELAICLFDRINELSISMGHDLENVTRMVARERLKVRGYGTIALCRLLDESLDTFNRAPDTPHLVEAAEVIIAMACLVSRKLVRSLDTKDKSSFRRCDVKLSSVYNTARLLFGHPFSTHFADRLLYSQESAEQIFKIMQKTRNWEQAFSDFDMPPALKRRMESLSFKGGGVDDFCELVTTLVCLAMCPTLDDCAEMKLVFAPPFEDYGGLYAMVRKWEGDVIRLRSHHIFSHICRLLVGDDLFLQFGTNEDGDTFMVSDFGWTVCLAAYGDKDPAAIDPERVYIREGVPTNPRTMERKLRVRDGPDPVFEVPREGPAVDPVSDRGTATYNPRCISPVQKRTEYVASRQNGFHISIKLSGVHTEHLDAHGNQSWFQIILRYRGLHESLWNTYLAPPCQHRQSGTVEDGNSEAKLGMGIATAAGIWSWPSWGAVVRVQEDPLPERLVVVLVKGDKSARWLSVMAASSSARGRQVMIRPSSSCENCAVQAAANMPGRWAIII